MYACDDASLTNKDANDGKCIDKSRTLIVSSISVLTTYQKRFLLVSENFTVLVIFSTNFRTSCVHPLMYLEQDIEAYPQAVNILK
jgi:hypothetical protein